MRISASWAALGWVLLAAAASNASERELTGALTVGTNPTGVQLRLTAGRRFGLTGSRSALRKDSHVALGVSQHVTPAYARTEAWLRLAPLSVLELRGSVQGVGYYGTFGNVVGFPGYDADFTDDARKRRKTDARSAFGWARTAGVAVKAAVGRVALRSAGDVEWWSLDRPGPYFYEPHRATLLAAGGDRLMVLTSNLAFDVSPARNRSRTIGVAHDLVRVSDAPQNQRQRLGLVSSFRLGEKRAGLREPTLALGVLHYLEAPNRDGRTVFVSLGFALGHS